MNIELRIPGSSFAYLTSNFESSSPRESGAFLLLGQARTADGLKLYVRRVLDVPSDAWRLQENLRLAPSTSWMSSALDQAEEAGAGLAFVHSHPMQRGQPSFSEADEWMHDALVPSMVSNLGDLPFVSLVFGDRRITGSAWVRSRRYEIRRISVIGTRMRDVGPPTHHREADHRYARQVGLWGQVGQQVLQRMSVGVVGLGGTGSAVAEQLARLGVGHLVLVDMDLVEKSNLTRLHELALANVGERKAHAIAAALEAIGATTIRPVCRGVEDRESLEALIGCDLVFGCTDNHASRAVLNDLSLQHLLPIIDVGCRVGISPEGRTRGIGAEVRVVNPDTSCYLCGHLIDPSRIRDEAYPGDMKRRLQEEGYVPFLREEPGIVPVTTITASLGVMRFLDMVLGLLEWQGDRLLADLHDLNFMTTSNQPDPSCFCRGRLGLGSDRQIWTSSDGEPGRSIDEVTMRAN